MGNRILLVGNEKFTREAYKDGIYYIMPEKKYLNAIYESYEVDNISNLNLDTNKAINLIKLFCDTNDYDFCVICFGENEIRTNSPIVFKKNLQSIINILKNRGIAPIFVEFVSNIGYDIDTYNKIIRELKDLNNVESKLYCDCIKLANA